MTDWTIILTTVGTATATGTVGYLAARRQSLVALRQIDAESERLRLQHDEERRRDRQAMYRDFLSAEKNSFAWSLQGNVPEEMEEQALAALEKLSDLSNAVQLVGTQAVSDAVEALAAAYRQLGVDTQASAAAPDRAGLRQREAELARERQAEIATLRNAVFNAMRADIAPSHNATG